MKNLENILPQYKSVDSDNYPLWTDKQKKLIIDRLSKTDSLDGLFLCKEKKEVIPAWFILLRDDELFNVFIRHSDSRRVITKDNKDGFKKDYLLFEKPKSFLQISLDYSDKLSNSPEFFKYNANKLEKLIENGMGINYSIFVGIISEPLFLLEVLKRKLLVFDEIKIYTGGNPIFNYTLNNVSLITALIESTKNKSTEKIMDYCIAITGLLELGASSDCFKENKKKVIENHNMDYFAEHFYPDFFRMWSKFKLEEDLKNSLNIKGTKKSLKI